MSSLPTGIKGVTAMRSKLIPGLFILNLLALNVWFPGGAGMEETKALAETQDIHAPVINEVGKNPLKDENEKERGILAAVNRKEKELEAREEELRVREERLIELKKDIEARITELNKLHKDMEGFVKKIDEVNDSRVKRLVKIYESMNPEEAATRFEKLSEGMAVMILSSMNEKKAAKILGLVDVDRSVKLSQLLKIKN